MIKMSHEKVANAIKGSTTRHTSSQIVRLISAKDGLDIQACTRVSTSSSSRGLIELDPNKIVTYATNNTTFSLDHSLSGKITVTTLPVNLTCDVDGRPEYLAIGTFNPILLSVSGDIELLWEDVGMDLIKEGSVVPVPGLSFDLLTLTSADPDNVEASQMHPATQYSLGSPVMTLVKETSA